jgi:multidrug efflux pump subunit AcrA (membrane-fusion protein)
LFEIDPADYQTALESAKASVAHADANFVQKQQDLDRETDLFQRRVNSKQEFQNAQNAFASAQAQLAAARANLQQSDSPKPVAVQTVFGSYFAVALAIFIAAIVGLLAGQSLETVRSLLSLAHRLDVIADDLEIYRNQALALTIERYWGDYSV